MLAEGSRIKVTMAKLYVDTPYFVGEVNAWCMQQPTHDLIIGNIKEARDPNDPDVNWTIGAVQTRQRVKNMSKPLPQLKVPEAIQDVSPDDIRNEQRKDESLNSVRKLIQDGKTLKGKTNSSGMYLKRKGMYYRQCQSPRIRNSKKFTQLIVPANYRKIVLK